MYSERFCKALRFWKQLGLTLFYCDILTALRFYWAIFINLFSVLKGDASAVYRYMWDKTCTFSILGRKIRLNGRAFGYAGEIYIRKVYFQESGFDIRNGMTVVDLGAANGVFSVLAAALGARVISLEPTDQYFREFRDNAVMNNVADRIDMIQGVVGDRSGWVSITPNDFKRYNLSDILRDRSIDRIDYLKVDIEGSEFDLFSGGPDWLPKVSKIAMEVHPPHGDVSVLIRNLEQQGFVVVLLDLEGRRVTKVGDRGGYIFAVASNQLSQSV